MFPNDRNLKSLPRVASVSELKRTLEMEAGRGNITINERETVELDFSGFGRISE